MTNHKGEVSVVLVPYLSPGTVKVIGGTIYAHSVADVLAQVELERRREDAVAAYAPRCSGCNDTGFSQPGTGYDDVCSECGGQSHHE